MSLCGWSSKKIISILVSRLGNFDILSFRDLLRFLGSGFYRNLFTKGNTALITQD